MWFITAILTQGEKVPIHRTFGYYEDYWKAKNCVANNYGSMQECLYNYIVVEKIGEGIHALPETEEWYRWDERWVPCEKPMECEGIINWALG